MRKIRGFFELSATDLVGYLNSRSTARSPGKTFTGARMICELVRRGKTVGITANSHKVIRNLIDATIEAADECGAELHCCPESRGGGRAATLPFLRQEQ